MRRRNDSETSLWISTTDLMSGMLVVFLFIAVLMMQQYTGIVQQSTEAQQELKENINAEFTPEEQKKYSLNDAKEGIGYAKIGEVTGVEEGLKKNFDVGSADLPPELEAELRIFLPKYIRGIAKCKDETIKEVRIEGHTSSEWRGERLTPDGVYIKNMELSQARTRAIIELAFSLPELAEYKDFMKRKLTANGLSFSKLKYQDDGITEDREASRRIEFRAVANDEETVKTLRNLMK